MGAIQSNDGILEVVENPSVVRLQIEEIQEQAGLIYINKLMNSIFSKIKRSLISEELIRDLINSDLAKTGLTLNRFNWKEVQENPDGTFSIYYTSSKKRRYKTAFLKVFCQR